MKDYFDNAPAKGPEGNMRGFDAEFTDIVDYILRITYRIWEGKQVGLCHDYYSEDCPVYTLGGYVEGAEVVMQNTLKTLSGYPDRTLHADNIIWGGDDVTGYHSSHLICTNMTNLGPNEFGPATGKRVQIQVIAHCVCKDNKIVEEWLVRDNYSLAEQLGYEPLEVATQLAQKPLDPASTFAKWLTSEHQRVSASGRERTAYPSVTEDRAGFIATALHNIWNARMLGDCNLVYAENARLHASARDDLEGVTSISRFYMEILGAMPDAKISADYSCVNSMNDADPHVAVRWVIAGHHTGNGRWGEATGAPLLILGESHYRFEGGKVVEEWLVFDELAVLTQVQRARLAQVQGQE
ncbi:ester cyclase [Microbulbifer salipaludis]|uniref:Ester cyclase n=1 Tax=Microbulbifer salipaludis TaxID=187980 RepID=A0ABS3E7N1_9GAMM|nr:ester cyclase [Microbulbifer salipaludis]MBN8431320.1 ester cyclase [Microbulbifer salipaludis]